jgi:hypothetical protein
MAIEEDISLPEPSIPNLSFTESGYNGLSIINGRVLEECNYELQWPYCVKTFKDMAKDGTIAPSIDYVQTKISNVDWFVSAPKGYEEELKDEVLFLGTMMRDMDHSWLTFIKQAASFVHQGFCIHEIVPRRRLQNRGSRFNDGFIGIKKLALRSQDTIIGWNYKNKGRDLKEIIQKVNIPSNKTMFGQVSLPVHSDKGKSEKAISIDKCLHFRNNPQKDNPLGSSPLVGCWRAYKYKVAYEEAESSGVGADIHGFKTLKIPAQYMSDTATDDQKATYEYFKKFMRNAHVGKESGLVLPSDTGMDQKPLFEFDVVSITGSKSYDINKIIERYQNEIKTTLYATFLSIGQSGGGSYALSESAGSFADEVVRSKLEEIRDVLNHKLIPYIFNLNGWKTEVYPTFEYGDITTPSLDERGKFLQRAAAVGLVAYTAKNLNAVAEWGGLPDRLTEDMSLEEVRDHTGKVESKAGQGMEKDMPSGTGSSNGNNSSVNSDNAE